MADAGNDASQATVREFFARMNAQGVDYALLRNYEQYPDFGHDIDLIVRWDHLSRWKAIAKSCAEDFGWSALTDCDHWAGSGSREHCVQALRFYAVDSGQYLEFDAFHSLLILGLPIAEEGSVLRGRVWDERGFCRIDERLENTFRLLQIARLSGVKGTQDKVERYRTRALSFWDSAGNLNAFASELGFSNLTKAMEYLACGDMRAFRTQIERQKRIWLIRWLFTRPLRGIKIVFDRLRDYVRLFWLRPCGFKVRVFASTAEDKRRVERMMNEFMSTNFIHAFTTSKNLRSMRSVLERGGIVVEWTGQEKAQVVVGPESRDSIVKEQLVKLIIDRHTLIVDRRGISYSCSHSAASKELQR